MFQVLSVMIFRVYHRLFYILSSGRAIKGEDCHENSAVLGQLCAKIITLRLKSYQKNASVKLRQRYQMNFITEG